MRTSFFLLFAFFLATALSGCSQSPAVWWKSLNAKAQKLQTIEANYHALEHEHAQLKKDYYRLENEYMDLKAQVESTQAGDYNLKATGSISGRAPSSIAYQVPKDLKADEQLTLGYEHFTENRFAEAAATFEDFFKKPEFAGVGDAYAMYTAGVSWFQLGNYKKAQEYFESARNGASGEQREKINKKVDLWMRAIDRKRNAKDSVPEHGHEQGGGTLGG